MKKILLAAVLLATPAAARTPTTLSFTQAIEICRDTFLRNPDKGKRAFEAIDSDASKQAVAIICLAYRQGALDLLEASGRKPGNLS